MGRYDRQRHRYPGLANRAQRQGRIATGPDRRATGRSISHTRNVAGRDVRRINRQGQQAAQSARRTSQKEAAFERRVAGNLHGLGQYTASTRHQLMVGAQQQIPYGKGLASLALHGARLDARSVQEAARSSIFDQRQAIQGEQHQATAQALNTLISNRRQSQASSIADAQQQALDKIKAQRDRQRGRIQDALGAVGDVLKTDPLPPQNEKEWQQFTQHVQSENPLMHPRAIEEAIHSYRNQQAGHLINYWARVLGLG